MCALWEPNCRPTGIGSLPHENVDAAMELIARSFSAISFWPQLPQRTQLENMYIQYSEQLPNRVIEDGRIYCDTTDPDMAAMEEFYQYYLAEDFDAFAIGEEYAQGMHRYLNDAAVSDETVAVKGQTTGPISFGMMVTDENRKMLLYSDIYRDLLIKNLQMKARWQETQLEQLHDRTIMFIDEPYLSTIGSAVINLQPDAVAKYIREAIAKLQGLTGIHCCGNTDWSFLLALPFDIISMDAYQYGENFLLYPDALASFLDSGGIVAWGIVPSTEDEVLQETVPHLLERFGSLLETAEHKGLDREKLLRQALITPSCGVGSGTVPVAERVFSFTAALAREVREKYALE